MRHLFLALSTPLVVLIAACPVSAERITRQHPDYSVLRLVQTKRDALTQLDESCRQAEQMREALQLVSDLSQPLLPVFDAIAGSQVLKVMTKIPGVGTPIEVIQGAASALRAVLGIVDWVNRTDQEYQAPIRDAILKSNQLLRSQDSRDVPPLLSSYRSACEACSRIETRLSAAQTQLSKTIKLVNLSVIVLDRLGQSSDDTRRSARDLADQLGQMQKIVALMLGQVREGHLFMQQVLSAANSANAIPSRSREVAVSKPGKTETSVGGVTATPPPSETRPAIGSPATRTPAPPPIQVPPNPVQSPAPAAVQSPPAPELPRKEVVSASEAASHPRRAGNSALVLVLSGLPGIAALLAIAWMIYNYYVLAPQRRQTAGHVGSSTGSANHMAALRLGGRQILILPGQPALIGSSAGLNSVYIDDPTVAAVHARIEFLGGGWWVTDLGSPSGTFIDERRVTQEALSHGQRLRFGNVQMVFTIPGGHHSR